MARMIPAVINPDAPTAEKRIHALLRDTLPDDHTVFHSFELLTPNLKNKLVEGEIDFLILFPTGDLLVFEVKGGIMEHGVHCPGWSQNGDPLDLDPFHQARNNRHHIETFLARRMKGDYRGTIGYALCFPDTEYPTDRLPAGAERRILIGPSQLPYVHESVKGAIRGFGGGNIPLPQRDLDQIQRALMPVFEVGFGLTEQIALADRVMFSLTEQQCALLEFIRNHRRALIQGCAGSGKTIMAVKKARLIAADPTKRVLLLAYNHLISAQLANAVRDLPNITAGHYHGFCLDQLTRTRCEPPPRPDDPSYWDEEIPNAFDELVRAMRLQFDAVIVDEGQDFRLAYWVTIDALVKPDGLFYIFFDPDQNVRDLDPQYPIEGEPFVLTENCRNSRTICSALKPHSTGIIHPHEGTPDGEAVVEYGDAVPQNRRKALAQILNDLVNNRRLATNRIVILGGHSLANTCIGANPQIGNFTVTDGDASGPMTVPYRTYFKFKGCEADAVILLDVDPADPRWTREAHYTAMSRAKHLLYVIRSSAPRAA